jgi:uncharacterized membrane protein
MRGPIDFIVVKFSGNKFEGEILSALDTAVQDGAIAVLDLSVISKDEDGELVSVETSAFYEALAPNTYAVNSGLIREDDVREIGELLENNTSAGLLIIEQVWARDLKTAILHSNGELIAEGRIHPEAAAEIDNLEEV